MSWVNAHDIDFNGGWLFARGEIPEAIEPDFDASNWESVSLPHDWSIKGPFSKNNPALSRGGWLPAGKGVYRKSFRVSGSAKMDKVFIYFDGAYRNSVVYLNGHKVGARPFGYIGFEYDLTKYIDFEDTNVLTVTLDNSEQPGSRWYSGSGIYRDVTLKVSNKVYVPNWSLYVTTPVIDEESAIVDVAFVVKNEYGSSRHIRAESTLSRDGSILAKSEEVFPLKPGAQIETKHRLRVIDPQLWSPESPELYEASVKLFVDGVLMDEESTKVGIRELSFDENIGFAINGVATKLKGVCLHHDGGPLGAAVYRRTLQRQLEILKEMGCNAVRTGHSPFSTEFLDLCDEMGILVMNDAFDEWATPKMVPVMDNGGRKRVKIRYCAKDFDDWAERDLADFVKRDRNHPSVIMWGIGSKTPNRLQPDEVKIAKRLTRIVSELDGRPVMNGADVERPEMIVGELKAQNPLEPQRELYPGASLVVGECYSAQSFYPRGVYLYGEQKERWWEALGYEGNASREWADRRSLLSIEGIDAWRVVKETAYVMGQFIWSGWDYLGETVPFGWPARSSSFAPIDLCGFPKDGFYFYQSQWTDEPMVHIFPHWNLEGQEGKMVTVYAYTNGDEVELFQEGRSLGKRSNDIDGVEYRQWEVEYQPGSLKAVASRNGKPVAVKEIRTAGKPSKIELFSRRDTLAANGKDLLYVECSVLDAEGNLVPNADNEIQFSVDGEATLIAVGNGDSFSHESFQASSRKAFSGRCLAIIKTLHSSGRIEVNATSKGLDGATLEVVSR